MKALKPITEPLRGGRATIACSIVAAATGTVIAYGTYPASSAYRHAKAGQVVLPGSWPDDRYRFRKIRWGWLPQPLT